MQENRLMLIAEKETFIVRGLKKKLQDSGVNHVFLTWDVNAINKEWEGTAVVALFMDDASRPPEKVLYFLKDKMIESSIQMMLIGEKADIAYVESNIPEEQICRIFYRPVDNAEFISAVNEVIDKVSSGENKKSILVVDDDPGYLNLVREWLKGSYKVSMVNSGLQAIKWLGKNKADLILLDHEMPVTTGPQVLEMLRNDDDTKNIPVIFLTGKGDKESVMKVVSLRPEGYFLKTIEKDELLEKLKEFFILHC